MIKIREKKPRHFILLAVATLSFGLTPLLLFPANSMDGPKDEATATVSGIKRSPLAEVPETAPGSLKSTGGLKEASPDAMEGGPKAFRFKEFSSLDESPIAAYLIESMDVMMSLPDVQAMKERALKGMNLKEGDTVLEVGCGHGEDAEALGKLVGTTGSVVAVDSSKLMIAEVQRRSKQSNVAYIVDDVTQLTYPEHTFSGCHVDRFLVSHATIDESLKKILRYIKPGGVVSVTEPDALSIVIAPYTRTTQIILDELRKCFVNPIVGRMLPEIFVKQGLQDIVILPETSMLRSFKTLSKIFQFSTLADAAIHTSKLTSEEAAEWFQEMHTAEEKGTFLYRVNFFTLLGIRPYAVRLIDSKLGVLAEAGE